MDYAQSLYEKRLITYPRTDSRFLTEDMAESLPGLVTDTGKAFAVEEPVPIHVQQVINGSKVTDHHALLPTKSMGFVPRGKSTASARLTTSTRVTAPPFTGKC